MDATDVEVHVPEPMTNLHTGLTTAEVDERLAKYGKNEVVAEQTPWYMKVLVRYCGLVPIIMLVVSLLSATIVAECEDDIVDTSTCECKENRDWISFALLFFELNLIVWVDYLGEVSSGNAIEQLKKLSAPTTKVLRNGVWADLDKTLLVPGDIVGLVIGATVPSDGVLRGNGPAEKFAPLKIDAASVTGEPLPETKRVGDEVIAATTILTGELEMQVTHTGARSSIGKSMKLINEVGVKGGKLKTMLGNLARSIAAIAAVFCTLLFVVVVVRDGMQVAQAVKLSFVVLVAVLPVAMPVVITTGLAVGALELSRENAIVQRLSAIEEMAGMDILCSDKTGTLTKVHGVTHSPTRSPPRDTSCTHTLTP
jgi:H+-transporting ATPase